MHSISNVGGCAFRGVVKLNAGSQRSDFMPDTEIPATLSVSLGQRFRNRAIAVEAILRTETNDPAVCAWVNSVVPPFPVEGGMNPFSLNCFSRPGMWIFLRQDMTLGVMPDQSFRIGFEAAEGAE